ncbi:MAG: O-antigen ligase family protein [Chloroflexota bacterium]|nr:O-antigen ligase family protein [Chloroflexota bacterium]
MLGGYVAIVGVTALGAVLLLDGPFLTAQRLATLFVGLGALGVLYLSANRSAIVAVGLGWVAIALLSARMPGVPRWRRMTVYALPALFGIGVAVSPIARRLLVIDQDLGFRLEIWQAAAKAFVERPILGLGPDNFVTAYPSHRAQISIATGTLENSTHSFPLYIATSAGIVGIVAALLLVILLVSQGWQRARAGDPAVLAIISIAAYLGQSLTNVNEIALDLLFWIAAGVIASASATSLISVRAAWRQNVRASRLLGFLSLVSAATLAILLVLPRLAVGETMLMTESFAAAHRAAEVIPSGEALVSLDRRRGEDWSSYGTVLYDAGATAASIVAFSEAADRQPWQPLSWKNLAIAWMQLGNKEAAYAAARRIPIADPYDGEGRELIADLAYGRGDFVTSASEGELAIAYELGSRASAYFTTISAYVQMKDLRKAEPLAKEAATRFGTAQLRLEYAAILADEGKNAEAITALNALLKDQPNNVDARQLRDLLLKR